MSFRGKGFAAVALALLGLAACAPLPAGTEDASLPPGRWLVADGAGETALLFVPEAGGGEIVILCSLGAPAHLRMETPDAAFAAAATGPRADIVIGGLAAFEANVSRMPMDDARVLIQATTPITASLVEAVRNGPDFRMSVGNGAVQTGAAPDAERQAFANACAAMAGLAGP